METNGSGGLQLKGVVFNEMKGAMQDASSVFHRALYSSVFHKCTHHHNRYSVLITPPQPPHPPRSGGDPLVIPSLSHVALQQVLNLPPRHFL